MSDDYETGVITDLTMHEAIRQQVLQVLEDSDMTETQKQQICQSKWYVAFNADTA